MESPPYRGGKRAVTKCWRAGDQLLSHLPLGPVVVKPHARFTAGFAQGSTARLSIIKTLVMIIDNHEPFMPRALITYCRVSTKTQGRSGLGLEAQREALARFAVAEDFEIVREFIEIETGKG